MSCGTGADFLAHGGVSTLRDECSLRAEGWRGQGGGLSGRSAAFVSGCHSPLFFLAHVYELDAGERPGCGVNGREPGHGTGDALPCGMRLCHAMCAWRQHQCLRVPCSSAHDRGGPHPGSVMRWTRSRMARSVSSRLSPRSRRSTFQTYKSVTAISWASWWRRASVGRSASSGPNTRSTQA
jgi:hypothetical protein